MPLETITTGIENLNPAWPTGTDPQSEGDDHLRNIKQALLQSFPNVVGPWLVEDEIAMNGANMGDGRVRNLGIGTNATDAARKGEQDDLDDRLTAVESQLPAQQSFGKVNANTGIAGGSGDFSVARVPGQAVGAYLITFDEAASGTNAQALVCDVLGVPPFAVGVVANVFHRSPTQMDVYFFVSDTQVIADVNFNFIRYTA